MRHNNACAHPAWPHLFTREGIGLLFFFFFNCGKNTSQKKVREEKNVFLFYIWTKIWEYSSSWPEGMVTRIVQVTKSGSWGSRSLGSSQEVEKDECWCLSHCSIAVLRHMTKATYRRNSLLWLTQRVSPWLWWLEAWRRSGMVLEQWLRAHISSSRARQRELTGKVVGFWNLKVHPKCLS